MTPQIIVLVFWVVVILAVWLMLRSRWYRGHCEDLEAMRNAPETKEEYRRFELHKLNSAYQVVAEREKEAHHGNLHDGQTAPSEKSDQ
jgi:hypothetical protein